MCVNERYRNRAASSLLLFISFYSINQSINQSVYNVLFSMLTRVGRLDPQQLLHFLVFINNY